MTFLADMAFLMSNFDDFDNDQVSWKLYKSLCLHSIVWLFFLKNWDDSEKPFFKNPPIYWLILITIMTKQDYLRFDWIHKCMFRSIRKIPSFWAECEVHVIVFQFFSHKNHVISMKQTQEFRFLWVAPDPPPPDTWELVLSMLLLVNVFVTCHHQSVIMPCLWYCRWR